MGGEAERREDMGATVFKLTRDDNYVDIICAGVYNLLIDYNKWLHSSLYCQMKSWDI